MKQTKWQRLATIGLCSSLVINAFSGVTAVAETVTIESSPTAESSAKEETQASSVKEETTKASTENSQVTTDTSQEEETKEAEKQVETEVPTATPEVKIDTTEQAPATSSENDRQKSISPRWVPNNQVIYPRMTFAFTDETGKAFTDEALTLSGTYYKLARHTATSQWRPYADRYPIVSSNVGGGQYRVAVNATIPMPYDFLTNLPAGYTHKLYAIEQLKIDNTLKYVDSIVAPPGSINMTRYSEQQTSEAAQFGNYVKQNLTQRDRIFSKNSANIFSLNSLALAPEITDVLTMLRTDSIERGPILIGFDGTATYRETLNYVVTRKQVTEKFVDTNGVAITPPTGFTQNKKTPMTSNGFTFKQAGTLPDTYTTGGKTYKFKGWYKGKTKPATLETSKTPSYPVTYVGNDDLNVVYEEVVPKTVTVPAVDYLFGFINEKGVYVYDAKLTATITEVSGGTVKNGSAITSVPEGVFQKLTIPSKALTYTETSPVFYGVTKANVQVPKYYKQPTVKPGSYFTGPLGGYPMATIALQNIANGQKSNASVDGSRFDVVPNESAKPNNYLLVSNFWASDTTKTAFSKALSMTTTVNAPSFFTTEDKMFYFLENRRITENFVDSNGTKITPPTGFTQGKQTVIDSDNFTYTSAKALPASYTADGKTYLFQGWYKGSEKPATLETSKTPSYSVTYNDQDDLTAVYKEASISANLTMRGAVDVIDNGGTMEYWEVLLKNTGEAPLTSIKIKPTTEWESGISTPTELFILGTGQNTKVRPITKEQWETGFEIPLDNSLPVGGQLTMNLIGTKVTGQPSQVLKAAVEVTGNFNKLTASDTVRIRDLDQEIKEPTGEGFISVPTFDFGQVGVASATKQHGLKKAADYYGNGTRNPYVRISKTQPNWSLTAQLSQLKSATDSLPTATRLLLGAAPVSSFSNYNQPTELKNTIGTTNAINLTANNAATSIIANQQFIGSDVYQLDFAFDNIKLEVPANQGMAGQQYQATVTWNLVTGP